MVERSSVSVDDIFLTSIVQNQQKIGTHTSIVRVSLHYVMLGIQELSLNTDTG